MRTLKLKSQAGFSLIELMVVVAIIGILASVAIPSITKYTAKAKQTEAKTNLSSIYTGQKALFAEYNGYSNVLGVLGYAPEGLNRYNVGFATGGAAQVPVGYTTPVANQCGIGGTAANCQNSLEYCNNVGVAVCTVNTSGAANIAAGVVAVALDTFTAEARSRLRVDDAWTMNNTKVLTNTADGT
jgi:type IV pilus assembly protein PilA